MKKRCPVKHFYTLVELLVVVAIAAILFGLGLPAFNTLIKGNAMTSSINDLAGKIKATRAYAVANNCYTAIIFPCFNTNGGRNMSNLNRDLLNRSYRPCVVYPIDNEGKWNFDSWIDGENWKTVENGIIFADEASRSSQDHSFVYASTRLPDAAEWSSNSYQPSDYTFLAPNDGTKGRYEITVPQNLLAGLSSGDVTFYRAMIFRPNGQLLQNTLLVLQEGANIGTGVVATQDVPVFYALGVNKFNGKITYYEPVSP